MNLVKISVRNLVEFILRSGDIVASESGLADPDAMQEGTRIHKKLQKKMGSSYQAEVPLSITRKQHKDGIDLELCVEGRADGIFPARDTGAITIDEIKGTYHHLSTLKEPVAVHRAQALCYAYIYACQKKLSSIDIRMTYCFIPTEEVRYFYETLSFDALEHWFHALTDAYAKWMAWQINWQNTRNESIRSLTFPFTYREGQNKLVRGVYQSILREKRLYIEAPTGVGKTISTVFPAVKSIGEGLTEKIFYLTAKTITRTVAEETFHLLAGQQMQLKYVTLTAKEKICILEKPQCNPGSCPRAHGHFDRINDAVFDLLTHVSDLHLVVGLQLVHFGLLQPDLCQEGVVGGLCRRAGQAHPQQQRHAGRKGGRKAERNEALSAVRWEGYLLGLRRRFQLSQEAGLMLEGEKLLFLLLEACSVGVDEIFQLVHC